MEDSYMATSHLNPIGRVSRYHSETLGVCPLWLVTWQTAVRIPSGKTRRDDPIYGQSQGAWLLPWGQSTDRMVAWAKNARVSPTDPSQAQGSSSVEEP